MLETIIKIQPGNKLREHLSTSYVIKIMQYSVKIAIPFESVDRTHQ